jgi:hypothetical protein
MIAGGVLDQQKMTKPKAAAAKLFGLTPSEQALLNEVNRCAAPARRCRRPAGCSTASTNWCWSTGSARKALIEEEFGDGIM